MTKDKQSQLDMAYKFDPTWIRVMSSIIKTGDTLKKAGPTAFTVMCVLRAYKNLGNWGDRYPSIKLISERMGKTPATIHKALNKLEELKLISRTTIGRKNTYELAEGANMELNEGFNEGVVDGTLETRFPYDPVNQNSHITELKELAKSGVLPSGSVIQIINKPTFNITVVEEGGNAVVFNSDVSEDFGNNKQFAEIAKRMMAAGKEALKEQDQTITINTDGSDSD